MHVLLTQCLTAATDIHTAMCLFDDDHHAQQYLNKAMHSALIGAEQVRQLHKSTKHRLAVETVHEAD
jgi:hypothetical protein